MQQIVNEFISTRLVGANSIYSACDEQANDMPQAPPPVPGGASRHLRAGAACRGAVLVETEAALRRDVAYARRSR